MLYCRNIFTYLDKTFHRSIFIEIRILLLQCFFYCRSNCNAPGTSLFKSFIKRQRNFLPRNYIHKFDFILYVPAASTNCFKLDTTVDPKF